MDSVPIHQSSLVRLLQKCNASKPTALNCRLHKPKRVPWGALD